MKNKYIYGSIAVAALTLSAFTLQSYQEAQKETCGCGDICQRKISCELPGCAREHHKPVEGTFLAMKKRLSKAAKGIETSLHMH